MKHIVQSTSDFNRIRDGRESPDAYFDVDLSATSDAIYNIAGNSFYIDANPADGNAVVYFQDTDRLRGPTPFYVSPGFIARIPFTQIRVVNSTAQTGKKIRIVYGVDTDFQPGSVSQVSFAGNVNINGATYNASLTDNALSVGANVIISPASNTQGVILSNLDISYNSSAGGTGTILAKTSAPASIIDGDGIGAMHLLVPGATAVFDFKLINPLFISPGKGLYLFTDAATVYGSQQFITATWQQ